MLEHGPAAASAEHRDPSPERLENIVKLLLLLLRSHITADAGQLANDAKRLSVTEDETSAALYALADRGLIYRRSGGLFEATPEDRLLVDAADF